jgi:hypothetical protein
MYRTEPVFVNLLRGPGIDSQPGGINSLESIPGLLKRLQLLYAMVDNLDLVLSEVIVTNLDWNPFAPIFLTNT